MTVQTFRDLIAWQKAIDLVCRVYRHTRDFPRDETYGLSNQLRRAAISIPSNIAEGQARHSTKEFLNFLSMAQGSLAEVETQLIIAFRLGYLDEQSASELGEMTAEVGRLLHGLRRSLTQTTDH